MTDRIYYTDPYCAQFTATVRRAFTHEGRPAVLLDRTAFYPTSGGQPFDTGRLGNADVTGVVDLEEEGIAHLLSAPLREGETVAGAIDWTRRFDHMQQHTGQHVFSAAFERLFEARTVSFHLGTEVATIDLSKDVTADQIAQAEVEANRVVWSDRPVAIRFVSAAEAATLPLRKEPVRTGTLRLIEIEGFDLSACGGTHVARTGAIGIIAATSWERFKGGCRVSFVCGHRAMLALRRYRDTVAASVRALSVLPEELPGAIQRMQAETADLRRSLKRLQETAAAEAGKRLALKAPTLGGRRVVVEVLDGWDANGLKTMASAATAGDDVVIALFSAVPPVATVLARSKNVSVDLQAVFKQLVARFGGRGGGKPDLVQGGGFAASAREVAAAVHELFKV